MNKELQKLLLQQQEQLSFHKPIRDEFSFYKDIQSGNPEILLGKMDIAATPGMGVLSSNHLRNLKYHLIILTAMISRFCIEGGMNIEIAYTMSDIFIRKIDTASSEKALSNIKKQVITDYTKSMHDIITRNSMSMHVSKAMDYIQKHLTELSSTSDIAQDQDISADYLSKLFKKETGMTLTQYVLFQKCEMAKYMLVNSNVSCTGISSFLGFASCSHFISRFKLLNNITPAQYRKKMVSKLFSTDAPPE